MLCTCMLRRLFLLGRRSQCRRRR
ncbi:hypothetical protein LINGRAHAP2_LOCUS14165 [Linum grandiflorum]